MSKSKGNGIDRTLKKIKYMRKNKNNRNNARAKLKQQVKYGDY